MGQKFSGATRYLLYGALFGLAFPLVSFVLVFFFEIKINVLLIIIATAPVFLGIFARFAGVRQDQINEVNRGLEETVASRTQSIRNLLDVSGEGYLSFGADFLINDEYSRACTTIFGRDIAGLPVETLLFTDEEKQSEFRQGLGLFFEGKSRGDVIFGLLDSETEFESRVLELDFKEISNGEILCAVKDVSDQRALADVRDQDAREQQIVVHVVSHRKYFKAFSQEAAELFEILSRESDLALLQRKVHTFKGNASFFRFDVTKTVAHEMEYQISDSAVLDESIDITDAATTLKTAYYSELEIVERRLGTSWMGDSDMVSVPSTKYRGVENYVRSKYPDDSKLNGALKSFRMVRMDSLFVRFPDMAERLAEQIGRRIKPLTVVGGGFPVLPERYEALAGTFVHIIRNMLDHGVESPAERELKNKSPEGQLEIILESHNGVVSIQFRDDGKGLSTAEILRKARSKGLIPEGENVSKAAVYGFIFRQDFSTSGEVTEVSGRGHGLAAVKEEVEHMGGRISLSSIPDKGTTFKISIPERRKRKRSV